MSYRFRLKGVLSKYDTVSYETPGDGNCFFHAICNAYFVGYRKETVSGNFMSKRVIVTNLRRELSEKLLSIDPETKQTYYDGISNGNVSSLGATMYRYSPDGMISHLNSNDYVGDEVIAYTSKILNKDIYILNKDTNDVYNMPDLPSGDCPSIVLLYGNNHYELVGVKSGENYDVYLSKNHPFILDIRNRLLQSKS